MKHNYVISLSYTGDTERIIPQFQELSNSQTLTAQTKLLSWMYVNSFRMGIMQWIEQPKRTGFTNEWSIVCNSLCLCLSYLLFTSNSAYCSYSIYFQKSVKFFCILLLHSAAATLWRLAERMCINAATLVYIRQAEKSILLLRRIHCWEIFTALQKWESCLSFSLKSSPALFHVRH